MAKQNILNKSKIAKAEKAIKGGKLKDALKILTQLCSRDSADAASWILLASVYGRMNNFQGVGECCMKALTLEPENTAAMNYLGNVYTATKQYTKAIASYKRSLEIKPRDISTLYNLSTLHRLQNNIDECLNLLQQVIAIKPDHFEALANLTKIYTENGYLKLAIQYCQQLNKLRPNDADILGQLGLCYARSDHIDQARDAFQQCLKFTNRPADILVMLADNELNSNQQDHLKKTSAYLSDALKADPASLDAKSAQVYLWYRQREYSKAQKQVKKLINEGSINANTIITYSEFCQRFEDCDLVISQGKRLLDSTDIKVKQRTRLHFCLGNIYDKKENYKEAFSHYQKGNDLIKSTPYINETKTKYISDIINSYSPEKTSPLQTSSIKTDVPVFIIGMPRSGTSLVEQILSSHPNIHGAGELDDIGLIAESLIPAELNLNAEYPSYINSLTTNQLDTYTQHYLNKLNSISNSASRITDKMPENFLFMGLIKQLFPQAKIIHCTRHPLDTILSIYFQNFKTTHNYAFKLENIAHYYLQYQRIMEHWKKDIEVLDIPYTSMVNNFENTCRQLINYTGLEWDEQCLQFHESKRAVITASYDQVRSPIYRSSLDRWKHYEDFLKPLRSIYPELFT